MNRLAGNHTTFEKEQRFVMNKIIGFIEQNKYGSLATCNGGKSDVRPFELVFHCDRGMFLYTSADEDVYEHLNVNPYISFCATDPNLNYVKISGSVIFSDNKDDKAKIVANSQFAQKVFPNSNLDNMKVFFLPHASCILHYYADTRAVEWQF
jgi:uncharacterized pyridoxamine 5'-phosphate oxidase family protein